MSALHYKFLDSQHVDWVLRDGTAMISALSYFRKLEDTEGDIGDPLEGATDFTVRESMIAREGSPELDRLNAANIGLGMFQQAFRVSGGGTINFGAGSTFRHVFQDVFIYSFSNGDLDVLTEEMCLKAERPYDACLRIKDAARFGMACFEHGTIKDLGCSLAEKFEHLLMGDVVYSPRTIDVTEGAVIPPDPFAKAERFRPQSETRLGFVPRTGATLPTDRLVIVFPDPADHFELVFRDRAKP